METQNNNPNYIVGGLMTLRELASYLHVTPNTVYRMVGRGEIPVVRWGGKRQTVRFRREDIAAWLNDRAEKPNTEKNL